MMKRALVTGAGGFCGKRLALHLRDSGVEVHTLGSKALPGNHHFVVPDITDAITLAEKVASANPDAIFHLAGVTHCADPALFYRVNTQYAVALFSAMDRAGLRNIPILVAGTAAEYGRIDPARLPVGEETPTAPYSHYGISKLAQTLEAMAWAKDGGSAIVFRPSNIIGPGMSESMLIGSFARQIAEIMIGRKEPVVETGTLSSIRDFIDVDDVSRILFSLAQCPAAQGQIVNICSGQPVAVSDLLATMIRISGVQIETRVDPARLKTLDVPVHYGSIKKLESVLGAALQLTKLDTSLQRILDHSVRKYKDSL